jgi:hypothetical protein
MKTRSAILGRSTTPFLRRIGICIGALLAAGLAFWVHSTSVRLGDLERDVRARLLSASDHGALDRRLRASRAQVNARLEALRREVDERISTVERRLGEKEAR